MADRPEHELAREVRDVDYLCDRVSPEARAWLDSKCAESKPAPQQERPLLSNKANFCHANGDDVRGLEPVAVVIVIQALLAHIERLESAGGVGNVTSLVEARKRVKELTDSLLHPAPSDGLREALRLVKDDAYAVSFQTMGKYRTALIDALSRLTGAEHE